MIGSSTVVRAFVYSAAEATKHESLNSRLPLRTRLRPSSPSHPPSTVPNAANIARDVTMRLMVGGRLYIRGSGASMAGDLPCVLRPFEVEVTNDVTPDNDALRRGRSGDAGAQRST